MENPKKKNESPSKWLRFSSIALQMGATIYLGNLLGGWLDGQYTTTFWEPTVTMIAVFISMYLIIKGVNQMNK
ncbi:hypothetical protein ULMS_03420 [Patiriisocius marinistellae]|uniref:AtpZ/AtpI family protein n=1 Tax=Patiriisocius marinistellae TaxID=2494560 RepID=A0A5J4FUW5_9FLAO|nr:AtpZ/AtpI family protein [Patiriisocius marinistellae]GEQ84834.1 hypothetical protein ULMS_03420 [Patiriisocius marinistellae]